MLIGRKREILAKIREESSATGQVNFEDNALQCVHFLSYVHVTTWSR